MHKQAQQYLFNYRLQIFEGAKQGGTSQLNLLVKLFKPIRNEDNSKVKNNKNI